MPYIKDETRKVYLDVREFREQYPKELGRPRDAGELNYMITCILNDYIDKIGKSYTTLNATIGVLECAKQEFYRRVVVPYEEMKCKENGDVYI